MGTNKTNNGAVKPFRIAVVGGAIGGLSTVMFLDHFLRTVQEPNPLPITIDVYEQASEYREIGNGIALGLNAAKLMHTVPGVAKALHEMKGNHQNAWFTFVRWDTGETIIHLDVPIKVDDEIRPVYIARSDYLDLLLGMIRDRGIATLHTKKKFVSVKDLGSEGVQLSFQDGTTADADLVIGSDGIHSEVRKQFVQGNTLYSGKIAYRGVVPIDQLPKETWPGKTWSVMWMGRHRHFLVFPIRKAQSLNIVAFIAKKEDEIPDLRESWSSTCDRSEMEADFSDFDETVQKIIQLMPQRPSKWRINDHEPVPQWTFLEGKVVLLGDACHATTPHQGAGAGQAIEDGYILSRALADWMSRGRKESLGQWMELYQQIRLPRAQKIVATSRQAGALYEFESPNLIDLPYEEAAVLVSEELKIRMNWIWKEDLDAIYYKQRQEAGL